MCVLWREGKAYRTELIYCQWVQRFRGFVQPRKHLDGKLTLAVREFLDHIVVVDRVCRKTQRQALNAVVYFCRNGLGQEPGDIGEGIQENDGFREKEVLSREEIHRLLSALPAE